MEMIRCDAVRMAHASAVTEVRRIAAQHAANLGWDEQDAGAASLIATELATNLTKHARDGVIMLNSRRMRSAGAHVQMVAVDRGPGMRDIARCLEDGYSTAGSPGTGLGAVRRLSRRFDVLSTPESGTIVVAEYAPAALPEVSSLSMNVGALCVAREGETVSGDSWASRQEGSCFIAMVCDGLGHGEQAAKAAALAIRSFNSSVTQEPRALVECAHDALRTSRGAAMAIAAIDLATGAVRFCGVGNIAGAIVCGSRRQHLVSHDGIVGHRAVRIAEFSAQWESGSTLVMHSDGVSARWRTDEWPGLWQREPALIAAAIWRDHARGTDDSTVLVARMA